MVACRSEMGAVYMADGYARLSGKAGLVYGQHGPGAANVASALADAYWANSSVVSLTSSLPLSWRDRFEYQELDQIALHRPVTKWSCAVLAGGEAARLVRDSVRISLAPVPGPVHVEVPRDLLASQLSDDVPTSTEGAEAPERSRYQLSLSAAQAILVELAHAKRPVFIAGAGVLMADAMYGLVTLAERLQIPVATTPGGKGAINEDHPLSIGVIGRYSSRTANELVREADLALVIGSRLGGLATDGSQVPARDCRIIQIDFDPTVLGRTYPRVKGIHADARDAMVTILAEVSTAANVQHVSWAKAARTRVTNWKKEFERIASAKAAVLHPASVIATLRSVMAPEDILVVDTGYMSAWGAALFPVLARGRYFLRAAGSLGWAFPAALGAKVAAPLKRVVCVIGDGGIGYNIMEMETAVRCQIPTVTVVLNNGCLAFEYHLQRYAERHVIPEINDLGHVNYASIASALGGRGARVTTRQALAASLRTALRSDEPWLIDVAIDPEIAAPVTSYEKYFTRDL